MKNIKIAAKIFLLLLFTNIYAFENMNCSPIDETEDEFPAMSPINLDYPLYHRPNFIVTTHFKKAQDFTMVKKCKSHYFIAKFEGDGNPWTDDYTKDNSFVKGAFGTIFVNGVTYNINSMEFFAYSAHRAGGKKYDMELNAHCSRIDDETGTTSLVIVIFFEQVMNVDIPNTNLFYANFGTGQWAGLTDVKISNQYCWMTVTTDGFSLEELVRSPTKPDEKVKWMSYTGTTYKEGNDCDKYMDKDWKPEPIEYLILFEILWINKSALDEFEKPDADRPCVKPKYQDMDEFLLTNFDPYTKIDADKARQVAKAVSEEQAIQQQAVIEQILEDHNEALAGAKKSAEAKEAKGNKDSSTPKTQTDSKTDDESTSGL